MDQFLLEGLVPAYVAAQRFDFVRHFLFSAFLTIHIADCRLQCGIVRRLAGRGSVYGRYDVKEEVARGGQGAILRVWDQDLRRTLAMKVSLEPTTTTLTTATQIEVIAVDRSGNRSTVVLEPPPADNIDRRRR